MGDITVRTLYLEDRDAWDQQPDEPRIWFERFDIYRLLGPNRSIAKAYRKYRYMETHSKDVGKNNSTFWYQIAKEWQWQKRAEEWDDARREEQEDAAQEVYGDGLSFAHERIRKLKLVAQKLEDYILDPKTTRIAPYVIEQWRGCLDDIAKERGERQKETRVTGAGGGKIMIETSWGRGGSASEAWQRIEAPKEAIIDAVVSEEISE